MKSENLQENTIYNVSTFDYNLISKTPLQKRKKGNQGKRNNVRKYKDVICAFDIETTNDEESRQAFMYIWQFQFGEYTIIGRTWPEFLSFLGNIKTRLAPDEYIVVFIHNASFEFQFLRGIYAFNTEEVFAVDSRKVLKFEMLKHFEFRCSYLQTNMSLAEFTRKMGVENKKLSGDEFNYKKTRYPWTPLTNRELEYCINDVKGLVQAMQIQMAIDNDNLYTLPLTSTGYCRRDVKSAMRHFNKGKLNSMLPDYEVYTILAEAFRGGNTHGNRYYTGQIVKNVHSYDYVSSYPNVLINCKYPMSNFIRENNIDLDMCLRKMYKHNRACLMRVRFFNIKLNNRLWGCPYIPKAKCRNYRNIENDNGRVLSAEVLEISLTDIDFKIILDEYTFDWVEFIDFYHARYGYLPTPFVNVVKEYFNKKTELKSVKGQEVYYNKAKAKLNATYGMAVTSWVKQDIEFNGDFVIRSDNPEDLYNKSKNKAFLSYAWGVWCTAHARRELEEAIKHVGAENFIYCDTDSVKYIGDVDFKEFNKEKIKRSEDHGAFAFDTKGNKYYLGELEHDAEYKEFITMGAKKYAFVKPDNTIGITVAGVNKIKGAEELSTHGGLKSFKEGFIFREAGGTESVYNDTPEIDYIIREGRKVPITSNLYITDSTYTLGITGEYAAIIEKANIWRKIFYKRG